MSAALTKEQIYGFWGTVGELLRIALQAILANKMRSFLTVLGIIIGVLSVVAVVSIMQGVFAAFFAELNQLGADTMFIRPNYEMFKSHAEGVKRLKMTYEDALAIKDGVPQVKDVAPFLMRGDTISYRGRRDSTQIFGHHRALPHHQQPEPRRRAASSAPWTWPPPEGLRHRAGHPGQARPAEPVPGRGDPDRPGHLHHRGHHGEAGRELRPEPGRPDLHPPHDGHPAVRPGRRPTRSSSWRRCAMPSAWTTRWSASPQVLRRVHALKFGQQDDFRIFTVEQVKKIIDQFTGISTLVVTAIVCITLIVGGIGIMNIMLVSVTERTREIGIRMAVGAKRVHILYQFLIESVTLSTLGGVAGPRSAAGHRQPDRLHPAEDRGGELPAGLRALLGRPAQPGLRGHDGRGLRRLPRRQGEPARPHRRPALRVAGVTPSPPPARVRPVAPHPAGGRHAYSLDLQSITGLT